MTTRARGRREQLQTALAAVALAVCLVGCSFGLYDDDGSPSPGPWWPWVCPDGGDAAPDAGCPPARCPDGAVDGRRDGGC